MRVAVYDTIGHLRPVFTSRARSKQRLAIAQEAIFGPTGVAAWLRMSERERDRGGYEAMDVARVDGSDVLSGHQVWGLFDPLRLVDAADWMFEQVASGEVQERAQAELDELVGLYCVEAQMDDLAFVLLPADPANRNFMVFNHGVSCFAGVPGRIFLELWPSAGNLARLEPVLARAVIENLRWAWSGRERRPALGDMLALEGLAAVLVAERFEAWRDEPWLAAVKPPDAWEDDLHAFARFFDLERYDDVLTKVYGSPAPVYGQRPTVPAALPPDDLRAVTDKITSALDVTEPRQVAAHLYGDEPVARHGQPTVGLPPFAGFEVGYRLVSATLERTGWDLVTALTAPSPDLLGVASAVQT
jgi:uncharacterized protein YjaZ